MSKEKIIERLESLLKEELWGRINPKDVSINRFRVLDDFYNSAAGESAEEELVNHCREHLANYQNSVIAMYLLGLISFGKDSMDSKSYLMELLNLYVNAQKWTIVGHIADRILEFGENRAALRALALSYEKLKKVKEAVPIWEELIKINRFDSEVAKKLALALSDDKQKSSQYLKLAFEGYIKDGNYSEVTELLDKIIEASKDELPYFDKVERLLSDAQQKEIAAEMFKRLYSFYSDDDDAAIDILKHVLKNRKDDFDSRKKIIKHFEKKYSEHSQLQQFLAISKLADYQTPIKTALDAFENNIVFDAGNYVMHRTWGLGLIKEINQDDIVLDFKGKENHKMTVQMALQSLIPLKKDHFYVQRHENPEEIKKLFTSDFIEFFRLLINSHGKRISLMTIKKDLIPDYVEEKNWSKWWTKAKNLIKKEAEFAFSEQKKDEIFVRDKPVTYYEDLLVRYKNAPSFSGRLDAALDLINNVQFSEVKNEISLFVDNFISASGEGSNTKLILSYFILKSIEKYSSTEISELNDIKVKVIAFIKESRELPLISSKISSYDYKKDFINLIREERNDWSAIFGDILFETPVRIHKYIMNILIREHQFKCINGYIERVTVGAKEFPELFLWVARNILSSSWNYDWLDYSVKDLSLALFRLVYDLKRIELKSVRLKNIVLDIVFGGENEILKKVISENDKGICAKLYDMAANSGYLEDWQLEKIRQTIVEKFNDFAPQSNVKDTEQVDVDAEEIFVLKSGFDKKTEELSAMINVEMVQLTKELSVASDLSGDMRENVDYSSLLEKQSILKKSISKLDSEIKKAKIIDLSKVSTEAVMPGTVVELEKLDSSEKIKYAILGPWDADYEKNILSYRSELAKALLKKKQGETADIVYGDIKSSYKILSIETYKG